MNDCMAVINAGSSSIKFAVYDAGSNLLFRGQMEKIGTKPRLCVDDPHGLRVLDENSLPETLDHRTATATILETAIRLLDGRKVHGIGHRVVHGGTQFSAPVLVDDAVVAELAALTRLAPLHQPHNLAAIEAIGHAAPHIRQVACFDTAFHSAQPRLAQLYAIPRKLSDAGVRRYGFHGLSYEYVSDRLKEVAPDLAAGRTIIAHLGNGASLCAIRGGTSQATTMGFTAVEGLVMGTRCGSIDPGVLIYLMDQEGMDARQLEDLVYRRSGLLGVSGISSDMRTLSASTELAAQEAIDLFVYRIVREIGSLAAALGGLDGLVFTGGIGENDARIRRRIAEGCAWLGAVHGDGADASGERRTSAEGSGVEMWVIPTDEERMILRHTARVLASS